MVSCCEDTLVCKQDYCAIFDKKDRFPLCPCRMCIVKVCCSQQCYERKIMFCFPPEKYKGNQKSFLK